MSLDKTREQSLKWCEKHAVDTRVALRKLSIDFADPVQVYPEVFKASQMNVAQCPQAMGGGGNLPLLYCLARGSQASKVIETGVAYGWSSLAILLALSECSADARLMSTNLHYPRFDGDERFVGCAVPQHLRSQWTLVPVADCEGIPEILRNMPEVDLVHYDSDKRYEGRMASYPKLWDALRVGGLFVSDDIDDNVGFMHFSRMVACEAIVVRTEQQSGRTKYVGVIRKPDDRKAKAISF